MKLVVLSVMTLALSTPARAEVANAVDGVARPAYHVVQSVTDEVYDVLRSYFAGGILPGGLSRGLERSPRTDSYDLFQNELSRKETRAIQRLRESYPVGAGPVEVRRWSNDVVDEEVSVVVDSMKDALIERHRLEAFGRYTGDYARDSRHWDAEFLVPATVLGSAFLYVNGMHANLRVQDLSVAVDLRSGLRLRNALAGAPVSRLAGLELGYRQNPLRLTADWGLAANRRSDERIGLRYSLHY